MRVIVTKQIHEHNMTASVQVEELMDEKNPQKIKNMKDVIGELVPMGQSSTVQVQCLPAPSERNPAPHPGKQKMISGNQLKYLRDLLRENNISEAQCCKENNVNRLEELSNDVARPLIKDLKQRIEQ